MFSNYVTMSASEDLQCIVISLKDMFYEKSQGLVGICRDVTTNSSKTLTLDLTKFDRNEKSDDESSQSSRKRRRSSASSLGPRKRQNLNSELQ